MYGPLWRLLPGSWPVKAFLSMILAAGVVVLCFLWVFPTIAPLMPFNDNTIQTGSPSSDPATMVP